jgi:hypothetical protein
VDELEESVQHDFLVPHGRQKPQDDGFAELVQREHKKGDRRNAAVTSAQEPVGRVHAGMAGGVAGCGAKHKSFPLLTSRGRLIFLAIP